jgi:hypothetical protein
MYNRTVPAANQIPRSNASIVEQTVGSKMQDGQEVVDLLNQPNDDPAGK